MLCGYMLLYYHSRLLVVDKKVSFSWFVGIYVMRHFFAHHEYIFGADKITCIASTRFQHV